LVKFGELSYEMMDLIAELLILRRSMEPQVYILKRRELLTRWTVFLSIRGEVMAAFGRAFILSGDYQGIFHALQTLRSYVGAKEPVAQERFEPEQEKFLAYRETVVSHMVRAMNLMSGKEWSVEVERARVRVQEADTAARALIEGSAAPPSGTPAA
jgi:hypothetical protein